MFCGIGLSVRTTVFKRQTLLPLIWYLHIGVVSIRVRILGLRINFIRKGQHTIFHREHPLIIYISADGIPRAVCFVPCGIFINWQSCVHRHLCKSVTFTVIPASIKPKRHGKQAKCINFIASFKITVLKTAIVVIGIIGCESCLSGIIFTKNRIIIFRRIIKAVVIISRHGKFVLFHSSVNTTANTCISGTPTQCHGIPFHSPVVYGYNIEDTSHSFGIIFCARIGNNFNVFDGVCRHAFQYFLWITTHHGIGFAVYVYLKVATSVYLNVIFSVNRYQRNFSKHFYDRIRFGIGVILYVVFNFINIDFHQWLLRHNFYSF